MTTNEGVDLDVSIVKVLTLPFWGVKRRFLKSQFIDLGNNNSRALDSHYEHDNKNNNNNNNDNNNFNDQQLDNKRTI